MGTRSNRLAEAVRTSTHNLWFEQKYEKISEFLSESFHFLAVKFSIYLNRRGFIMSRRYLCCNFLRLFVRLLFHVAFALSLFVTHLSCTWWLGKPCFMILYFLGIFIYIFFVVSQKGLLYRGKNWLIRGEKAFLFELTFYLHCTKWKFRIALSRPIKPCLNPKRLGQSTILHNLTE